MVQPVPGLLGQPNVADPQLEARRLGLLAPGVGRTHVAASGYPTITPEQMQQVYGTMAQYADNPATVGDAYVRAMQRDQQFNDPTEKFLRMYGNVNPFDFEVDSLQKFHEDYVKTGQPRFELLQRKNDLNANETKMLQESAEAAVQAQKQYARMGDLSQRFMDMHRSGNMRAGLVGSIDEWFKRLGGSQDEVSQLKTEYNQLKISDVVGNLPPGVASDKDVALVLEGWPPDNAGPAYISAFLRGMQKLKAYEASYNEFKTNYGYRHKGLDEGFLPSWQMYQQRAAEQVLGAEYWNPRKETGEEMSPLEAAQYFYDTRLGGEPVAQPPSGDGSIEPPVGKGADAWLEWAERQKSAEQNAPSPAAPSPPSAGKYGWPEAQGQPSASPSPVWRPRGMGG